MDMEGKTKICKSCGVEVDAELIDRNGICWVCLERSVRASLKERARRRGYPAPSLPLRGDAGASWPAGLGEMARRILSGRGN